MKAKGSGLYRHLLAGVVALALGLVLLLSVADRLWAAIELAYYRGSATNNAVFLEWATVREFNLNGFEILCKRASDPGAVYHPIGSRIAQGSPDTGATYNFNVTSGLVAGESYCFRLREVTSDGTPGEAFDLCGYGPGLTPAPTPITNVLSLTLEITPTTISVEAVPGLEAPTLSPTLTPIPPTVLTATPTLLPGQQAVSPLADPNLALTPTVDPNLTLTPTVDPNATLTPTVDPNLTLTPISLDPNSAAIAEAQLPSETPTTLPTDTPFPTETPTETATVTPTETQPASPLAVDPGAGGIAVVPDASMGQSAAVEATPTPPYVVVTATSTPEGLAMVAPTFTPWPTAMPTPSFSFDSLLVPNTQNLMVGLLCLIFMSASGLGALGLVTSVLYMRSQSQRERLPGPLYERRRY